jgi:hypothetical protein
MDGRTNRFHQSPPGSQLPFKIDCRGLKIERRRKRWERVEPTAESIFSRLFGSVLATFAALALPHGLFKRSNSPIRIVILQQFDTKFLLGESISEGRSPASFLVGVVVQELCLTTRRKPSRTSSSHPTRRPLQKTKFP